jgi:hypothetical protein
MTDAGALRKLRVTVPARERAGAGDHGQGLAQVAGQRAGGEYRAITRQPIIRCLAGTYHPHSRRDHRATRRPGSPRVARALALLTEQISNERRQPHILVTHRYINHIKAATDC